MKKRSCRPDFYGNLGVAVGAGQRDIERAFWQWREDWRAGRVSGSSFRRAERAYVTLADPKCRRAYDRSLGHILHPAWTCTSAQAAEESFRACLRWMERGRGRRALRYAKRSVALEPRNALYRSVLGLLTARTGGDLRQALHLSQRAYEQCPCNRRIALNFASVLHMAGLRKRSRHLRQRHRRSLSTIFDGLRAAVRSGEGRRTPPSGFLRHM